MKQKTSHSMPTVVGKYQQELAGISAVFQIGTPTRHNKNQRIKINCRRVTNYKYEYYARISNKCDTQLKIAIVLVEIRKHMTFSHNMEAMNDDWTI